MKNPSLTYKPRRARGRGFAYLLLLIAIAVLGIAAVGSVTLGQRLSRRSAEQALLIVGEDFRIALASYRAAGGSGLIQGPAELGDLLRDPRVPGVRRHLRQIYADPLTGKPEWGLVRDHSGGVIGVYSLAEGKPIKRTGFELHHPGFDDADSYADWVFGDRPQNARPRISAMPDSYFSVTGVSTERDIRIAGDRQRF